LILVLALALIFLITAARLNRFRIRWRALGVILIPSALTTFTWFFFSPPAFRFGWGPVFSLLIIPIGVTLFTLARSNRRPVGVTRLAPLAALTLALGLVIVTSYTSAFRLPNLLNPQPASFTLGSIAIKYQLTPVVDVPTQERVLSNGLVTTFPTESDQCWDNYPLCTPIVSESVRLRGEGIQNGFLP
jgi:peptidoglycan/LPS O-acetylase OafA/YrhL